MALTATATSKMRKVIISNLNNYEKLSFDYM